MDYETDIEIDPDHLDLEWLDHSSRMLRYCTYAAETNKEMDLAKVRLDVIKAQLDQQVRSNPDQYNLGMGGRLTEASIQAAVITDPEYMLVSQDYIDKKFEHEVAVGVVKSFEHRKSSLENLVRLHGQSYFAGPAVPHNLAEERTLRRREVNARVRITRRT